MENISYVLFSQIFYSNHSAIMEDIPECPSIEVWFSHQCRTDWMYGTFNFTGNKIPNLDAEATFE